MIRFVFLSVLFRMTIAHDCRYMQNAYREAVHKSVHLGAIDSTMQLVRSDDIGYDYFSSQAAAPLDANIDFNRTTTLLIAEQIYLTLKVSAGNSTLKRQSSCVPRKRRCSTMPIEKMPRDPRFRSITGAWNNKKNPKWGKSFTPYGHLLPLNYADGVAKIRKSVIGRTNLPGARESANAINKNPFTCAPEFPANHLSVMFGQLMAHDHGMRRMYQSQKGGPTRTCCTADYSKPLSPRPFGCHAFEYTTNDTFLNEASSGCNIGCQNYIRSQRTFPNNCRLGPLQAVNQVSHYLDLSPVYGNTQEIARKLRTFKNGELKNDKNKVLPRTCDDPTQNCYLTGDPRGISIFFLGILQSMYHRFHNVVAPQLKALNHKWNDERIFQETRRIVTACYQNHAMDWLRVFAGNEETKRFRPIGNDYVGRYDENVDASSMAEYSHCVLRVYHSNLADKVAFIDANNTVIKTINLDDNDDGLGPLETDYDNVARGMLATPAGHASFTATVRNKMFNNGNKLNLGLDLISTDLFIGRDLGLQPFYAYYEHCTGKMVRSWDDLLDTIPADALTDLKGVYQSVFDVDAYAGVALEAKCGSYLGTVGKCLVVEQYQRTTTGDRFFYSLPNGAYPFSKNQLEQIYKFSFSNLVCTVTELDRIPTNAFEFPLSKNPMVPCQRGIDLSAWKGLK